MLAALVAADDDAPEDEDEEEVVETIDVIALVLMLVGVEGMVLLVPLVKPVVEALPGMVIVAGGRVTGLDDAEAHWLMNAIRHVESER